MSPEERFPAYREIAVRIRRTGDTWKNVLIGEGMLTVIAYTAGGLFLLTLFAAYFPSKVRLALALLFLGGLVFTLVSCVFRPILSPKREREVARHIEQGLPELRNLLINAVQLVQDKAVRSDDLVASAIEESARETTSIDFRKAVSLRALRRKALLCAVTAAFLVGFALLSPGRFSNALERVLFPTRLIPALGRAKIIEVRPGNTSILVGEGVSFEILADHDEEFQPKATLTYQHEGSPERMIELAYLGAERDLGGLPTGRQLYSAGYNDVPSSFLYQVRLGRTESRRFEVKAVEKPAVADIQLTYRYPLYTGLDPKREENSSGDIKALVGTRVEMELRANKPVLAAMLSFDNGDKTFLSKGKSDDLWSTMLVIDRSRTYQIRLADEDDHENEPVDHSIVAEEDAPPRVQIVKPADGLNIAPGDSVTLLAKATDDYGVTAGALRARRNDAPVDETWREYQDILGRSVAFEYLLNVDRERFSSGDTITYHFNAVDNHEENPQSGSSAIFVIKVVDREADSQQQLEKYQEWQKLVAEILQKQRACRADTAALPQAMAFSDHLQSARTAQRDIRNLTLSAAEIIEVEDDHTRLIKNALFGIAGKEMLEIIKDFPKLDEYAGKPDLAAAKVKPILAMQDKIIIILEKILEMIPRLIERAQKVEEEDPGHDLPDDVIAKLQELAKKLKEFVEEQKKVIDQTSDLAKKPVDDLTDEDLLKLEELAAVEDKWEKFLKDAHSDFSMVPEQDFTNPSLLDELIEIYSEIEKAEDALTKKAVDIAVPIEQAGAELAETLTTHIEKWLPDSADRERWSMEEPLEEYDVPMAELPNELEDIIGELMEEEEDLFEDIEDVTSSWGDSIDKGAGWDALDGPISNMSAQGVTGNRLPNSSEIGGRSGEGRTGKSHGEFVEKTATGKGGRRTPTRLTPDPFEAGEVQDTSKEPPGGATGGGKLSGGGSEGLEGPVPPNVQKKMQALQGKQATLRNRAERADIAFKVINYNANDLTNVISEMKKVERDLGRGDYRNALRRRPVVLGGLKATGMFMGGEVQIRKDYTSTLPKELNDEILDARQNQDVPPGYEELLQNYFEAIVKENSAGGDS